MATVRFTRHLERFFPALADPAARSASGATVAHIIQSLDAAHPGLARYLIDERGALRKHVNIFLHGAPIADRETLSDPVPDSAELVIMQALSGG